MCVLPLPLRPHFDLTCSHSSLLSFQLIQFALIFALVRCVCVIRPSLLLLLLSKVQSVIRLVCSLRAIAMFYFFFFLPCLGIVDLYFDRIVCIHIQLNLHIGSGGRSLPSSYNLQPIAIEAHIATCSPLSLQLRLQLNWGLVMLLCLYSEGSLSFTVSFSGDVDHSVAAAGGGVTL